MTLNKDQIQQLYAFTQKHYVDWYDVQTELVDHLANGIEEQWGEKPDLSFEEALKIEFKKFGAMGFGEVVTEKTNALSKRYRKQVWNYVLEYFKIPKIVMIIVMIWAVYQLLNYVENIFWPLLSCCIIFIVIPCVFVYNETKKIKMRNRVTGKKWLFDNTLLQLGGLIHILNIGIYISIILDFERRTYNSTLLVGLSVFIVLFALVLYISIFMVYPKFKKDMAQQHPDYKFS